jgi:histone deacetylase 1/2
MQTRRKIGFCQPKQLFSLSAQTTPAPISPIPSSYKSALKDPNWYNAMLSEFNALIENKTWVLVSRPSGANVVTDKWIYRHKFHPDGRLARYKARWVLRGFTQREGIDYGETFSPVVKPVTIRTMLSLAVTSNWPIRQLDVKNAFLHGHLDELVYNQQPAGFVDAAAPTHVCKLQRLLYSLKQAPCAWFTRFTTHLLTLGFIASRCDTSLFILHRDGVPGSVCRRHHLDGQHTVASSADRCLAAQGVLNVRSG